MTTLLVIGKQGQLASALRTLGPRSDAAIVSTGREDLDLAEPETVAKQLSHLQPDAIINAAAYTAVDQAESDEEIALKVNAHSPQQIAAFARDRDIPFLHVSTDYVFSGDKATPYIETDETGPTGAYGRSKLLGEQLVLDANPQALIFRTAWVYSSGGRNFLLTMLKVGETRDQLKVVDDQFGNPTSATDLADGLLTILDQLRSSSDWRTLGGLYHLTGTGEANWCDFARAIFAEAVQHGHPGAEVLGIPTSEYPTPTKRPMNSRLDCSKAKEKFGVVLPHWRESVARTVRTYYEN